MQNNDQSMSTFSTHNALFGCFIMRRREQLEMTCAEAAELSGLSFGTWADMESGWAPELDEPTLFAIAGTLELPIDPVRRAASCYE